jgi:hypothetical protein
MPNQVEVSSTSASPPATPETTTLLLATFADLYRQEIGAEEDVHRTLPFFGTALGLVLASLAYAAGRLPKWSDLTTERGKIALVTASALLGLAIFEAGCVLVWLSRAIARRNYQRIGPEPALRSRVRDLQTFYDEQGVAADRQDQELVEDMRQTLLDSYTEVTPINRALNQLRYRFRALAASHLVRSLIWALAATTVIFAADKTGYLPKAFP